MIVSRVNREWAVRMTLLALVFLALACWSAYDGLVKYPRVEHTFQQFNAGGRLNEWTAEAQKQHWKSDWKERQDTNGRKIRVIYDAWDIRGQFIMAGIFVSGLLLLSWRLYHAFSHLPGADDSAFFPSRKERVPYAAVQRIEKSKWDRKGIAYIHFQLNGKAKKAKIDDWIWKDADLILAKVEDRVAAGK